jgi:hypothetical protein
VAAFSWWGGGMCSGYSLWFSAISCIQSIQVSVQVAQEEVGLCGGLQLEGGGACAQGKASGLAPSPAYSQYRRQYRWRRKRLACEAAFSWWGGACAQGTASGLAPSPAYSQYRCQYRWRRKRLACVERKKEK